MSEYILKHKLCDSCVWGEKGFYNPICAHCPYCTYGKKHESNYMNRPTAELLGLVKKEVSE